MTLLAKLQAISCRTNTLRVQIKKKMKDLDLNNLNVSEMNASESVLLNGGYAPVTDETPSTTTVITVQPFDPRC